ncbi:hypothetical protein QYF36_018070 [Acer negundo]|nr:hypothetical protein QYF36_018070 [Acer negundo]
MMNKDFPGYGKKVRTPFQARPKRVAGMSHYYRSIILRQHYRPFSWDSCCPEEIEGLRTVLGITYRKESDAPERPPLRANKPGHSGKATFHENGESNHKGESEGGSSRIHPAFQFRQFNIHTAYEFVVAQLVALFHQQKMLTGIFGIIHQLAGEVSLESQGRGYEVSFRTLPLLALLLFVCFARKRLRRSLSFSAKDQAGVPHLQLQLLQERFHLPLMNQFDGSYLPLLEVGTPANRRWVVNGKGDIFQSISVELGRIRNQSGSRGPNKSLYPSIHPSIGGKLTGVAMTGIRTYGGHQGTDLIASETISLLASEGTFELSPRSDAGRDDYEVAGNKRNKRSKLRSAAIGLLSLARRDRLTPGNLRKGLTGKAALLIKVKDQGSSAFVLWEYPLIWISITKVSSHELGPKERELDPRVN